MKYNNSCINFSTGHNNHEHYWFEFRVFGIGIDIGFDRFTRGIDTCTGGISAYATDIQRKRLPQNWARNLSLKGKLLKFLWVYFGWTRGFTLYPINQYKRWSK